MLLYARTYMYLCSLPATHGSASCVPRIHCQFIAWSIDGRLCVVAVCFVQAAKAASMAWYMCLPNKVPAARCPHACSLPSIGRKVYRFLRHEKGFGDVTIVLGCLSIPVFTGAVLICMLDALYLRRARLEHLHEE